MIFFHAFYAINITVVDKITFDDIKIVFYIHAQNAYESGTEKWMYCIY